MGSTLGWTLFQALLRCLLAVGPQVCSVNSLGLSFVICEIGVTEVVRETGHVKARSAALVHQISEEEDWSRPAKGRGWNGKGVSAYLHAEGWGWALGGHTSSLWQPQSLT